MTDEHPGTTGGTLASTAASADQDGGTVSLDDAARILSMSERTIRRMIKAGEIDAYKLKTPRGEVWRVRLGDPAEMPGKQPGMPSTTAAHAATTAASAGERPEVLKALEVIDELRQDNRKLADMNTQLAGQVGYLQRQVQEQQETIQRLLMAPKEDEPVSPIGEQTPAKRPWWKRLLGGRY